MSEFNPREPEQLFFARTLPDAEDPASFDPPAEEVSAAEAAEEALYGEYTPNEPSAEFAPVRTFAPGQDPAPVYDESLFHSNEPSAEFVPVRTFTPGQDPAPVYDESLFHSNEPSAEFVPVRTFTPGQDPAPVYDESLFHSNEPSAEFVPVRTFTPGQDPAPVYDESLFHSNEPSAPFAAVTPEDAPAAYEIPAPPQTDAPEAALPGEKLSRGALYAALKTEAGMNTDMLEPLPADGSAFFPIDLVAPAGEQIPAVSFSPEEPEAADDPEEPADWEDAEDGAADAVIEAFLPPEAGQPEKGSLKSKAAAARAAVYAGLKTEAGMNTDITEPLHPEQIRAIFPQPGGEQSPVTVAEPIPAPAAQPIPAARPEQRSVPVAAPIPAPVAQPAPAAPPRRAAVKEAAPVSRDATRPYPPLHGDEPTKIAPPLKRSQPAAQPEAPKAPVAPPTTAVPYADVLMSENEQTPINMPQTPVQEPAPADGAQEPAAERSLLAANLSAYYRRAAGSPPQQQEAAPARAQAAQPAGEDSAAGNVYRPREASWAQEERRTMLADEEAQTYQVRTEETRKPLSRRKQKRLIRRAVIIGIVAVLVVGLVLLYLSHRPKEEPVGPEQTPVVTATPKPIRGYDASAAIPVSDTADSAIAQISADVEMTPCAVTADNVLSRSQREDGLYDFYLFTADGQLLGYYDGLKQDGMCPMQSGGFYVNMPPYLVSNKGEAMVSLAGLETTMRTTFALRPFMNGWARIVADDGESNFIAREGNLLSRLWFCRSFSMTGTESVAYVDTGVLQSPTRYTLYLVNAKDASTLKWKDAADDRLVVTAQLGMAYLQSGELFRIADLFEDPEGLPLCVTEQVRFYLDCNAMVVKDAASGKYALYVNGKKLYDAVYDSILPVESDVRWKGDILTGDRGQAMVLTISGASYPQPMSYYFTLTRDGVEEHVALSAVTNCPILPD